MHKPPTGTGCDALDKAIEGAQIAVSLASDRAGLWRSPGRAVLDIVPETPSPSEPRPEQCLGGQPPRYTVPVRLFRPRSRPPACQRRGRSSHNNPPGDRAEGATLDRPRHEPGRTRRRALRESKPGGRDARATLCPHSQGYWAPVWCGRPARISVSSNSRALDHAVRHPSCRPSPTFKCEGSAPLRLCASALKSRSCDVICVYLRDLRVTCDGAMKSAAIRVLPVPSEMAGTPAPTTGTAPVPVTAAV